MAEQTDISWTDATWSPWEGCTKISPGCDHCYAASMNGWLQKGANWGPGAPRRQYSAAHWEKPILWNSRPFFRCTRCTWRGERRPTLLHGFSMVACPLCLSQLERTQRRVFPSVCDIFDNEVDPAWRLKFFRLISATPHLDWLLLTKRIGNARNMSQIAMGAIGCMHKPLPPNVWLGATVVNQEEVNRDIQKLLAVPARVRFLSCEPLLERVDLHLPFFGEPGVYRNGAQARSLLHWVIVGGESGRGAREFSIDAARSIVQQCQRAGVPVHVKQMGARPVEDDDNGGKRKVIFMAKAGRDVNQWPADLQVQEFPAV